MQITLDDVIFEDSIEDYGLVATYHTEISRKVGRQGVEDITRFQYIKEIHIDYGNVQIRYRDNAITTTSASSSNDTSSYYTHGSIEDPIIESYDILEKNSPTLYEILGLFERIYSIAEDFFNRLVVDRVHT